MSKVINNYPDWVEKYRDKGITIRKTTNGYGLYRCTSVYNGKNNYPRSKQEFLGMVYKDKGFIPKTSKADINTINNPLYLEYGLSKFIMLNFKRDLRRASYDGNEDIIKLGIINYIFDSYKPACIKSSYLTINEAEELVTYSNKVTNKRIINVSNKIKQLFDNKITDKEELNIFINLLKLTVINSNTHVEPIINDEIINISKKYRLKLWPKE